MAKRDDGRALLTALRSPDRYVPLGILGEGAVGCVERVYDKHLGRIVARKTLREALRDEPNALRTFANEARILGHLDHGSVIPIFDAYVNDVGLPVYTMREVAGRSLAQVLSMDRKTAQVRPLSLERTLKIVSQVGAALSHAHQRGVVHLDLKPQNIIVLEHDEILLVDWGAASIFDEACYAETLTSALDAIELDVGEFQSDEFIVGTPRYMSPEQTDSARSSLTPASDIFSLGILFYQMLSGRVPFTGESLEELLFHIRETGPDDPRSVMRGLHPHLAQLVLAMLEKNPEDRPTSLEHVLAELDAFRGSAGEFPLRAFDEGAVIFAEEDEAETAFVIVEGQVEISTGAGAERRVLGRHLPGDVFGELAVLRDGPRTASATALTKVVVRVIGRDALRAETESLSPWVLSMLEGIVERFVDRSERIVELLVDDGDGPDRAD